MGAVLRLLVQALRALLTRAPGAVVQVSRFGRVAFTGLIRNRALGTLTQQEIRNAMAQAGLREAHNAHFISRLVQRGPSFGIHTLDDLARALNNGTAQASRHGGEAIEIIIPNGKAAIVVNKLGELVTLTGL